jgi:hypothetical protein
LSALSSPPQAARREQVASAKNFVDEGIVILRYLFNGKSKRAKVKGQEISHD